MASQVKRYQICFYLAGIFAAMAAEVYISDIVTTLATWASVAFMVGLFSWGVPEGNL